MSYIKPIKIGSFECPSNLILAPMAGITDTPFRILCLKGGAGLVCAEMVSAAALQFSSPKSLKMLQIAKEEHPVSMQVFGGDAKSIAEACKLAQAQGADVIDINAGCPVKKVNKSGAGCVLMKTPEKIAEIVKAAVKSVNIPVTLKTRVSLNRTENLAPLLVKIAQDNGAAAITLHARAAADVHSGPPNIKFLESACKAASIPVFANGGVLCAQDAKVMFEAGAQAVMIGRGAIGNPFIFTEITKTLNGENFEGVSPAQKARMFLELVEENVKFYGERTGVSRSKKTVSYWIGGFQNASTIRENFVRCETLKLARDILSEAIKENYTLYDTNPPNASILRYQKSE